MPSDKVRDTWWEVPDEPKPCVFVFLILACALIGLVVYYGFINAMLFIPSSFLIIVFAGLWYGRKALWFALFLGFLHIVLTCLLVGSITLESLFCTIILCLVAFLTGTIVEQKRRFKDENLRTLKKFKKLDEDKLAFQEKMKSSQIACDTVSKKLKHLSGIMHNDIFNNVSALIGSIDLLKTKISDPEILVEIDRSENIARTLQRHIEFARAYEIIGTSPPQWLNINTQVHALLSSVPQNEIAFSISLDGLEIFVDPLFEKVFANLINNSLNHGVRVRTISVSYLPFNRDIAIIYKDDGIGIHTADKVEIFKKGAGKKTGFGLFLSREILSITGLSIKECGVYGEGTRFEIFVPEGKFRFA
ncbi:MAG: HAMP domain-containing sensor histidine kinase [Methanoregula sp.]|nr:HAMP domain-containing sensor histidine kinase [Methanoregula sp.]